MRKLNQRKIRWICREAGQLSNWQIAKTQKITPRHARRVYEKYKNVKHPGLLPSGRSPKAIKPETIDFVLKVRKEHPLGAVSLEKLLDFREGVHVPHNRLHRILKEQGLAKTEPKKSNRRKWIRYERRHSNSLWHADWFEVDRKQWIVIIDDASRVAVSVMKFGNATAENSVIALNEAVKAWGMPKQLMTDHGPQFNSVERETCENPQPNAFQRRLNELGVEHIRARVKHPQSNGKAERFVSTVRFLYRHFGTLEKGSRVLQLQAAPHEPRACGWLASDSCRGFQGQDAKGGQKMKPNKIIERTLIQDNTKYRRHQKI